MSGEDKFLSVLAAMAVVGLAVACASVNREVAKDQYILDLQGCVQYNATRAAADACIAKVKSTWDEAGAPKAATDGGKE